MARPPLGPIASDIERHLHGFLPRSFRSENSDEITLTDWYDGDGPIEPIFPYGTFNRLYGAEPSPISRDSTQLVYADDQASDTIPYTGATDDYLLEEGDVSSPGLISSVTATVGGTPSTVIPALQYEAVSVSSANLNAIRFLGPTYPDSSTSFTVTYRARRMQKRRTIIAYPVYRLTLAFQDLPSGSHGATRAYAKEELAHQACDWFQQRFIMDRGMRVGPVPRGLVWKGPFSNSFTVIDDAQRTRKAHLDVYMCRQTYFSVTDGVFIGGEATVIVPTGP